MQQASTAMAHNTMSYVRQAPQQFSRSFQASPPKAAAVNRSMASMQNMRASSSQQMAPLSLGQQYFTHVEVKLYALLHSATSYASSWSKHIYSFTNQSYVLSQSSRPQGPRSLLVTLSTSAWTAQSLELDYLFLCLDTIMDLQTVLTTVDLQERPVTKEVTTYVQERHPVAKQVGSICVQSPRTGPAFRAQSGPYNFCVHTPPLSSGIHVELTYLMLAS